MQKRGATEIIAEILKVASGRGITKTSLVYKVNLNFTRIERYIELLTRKGLVELQRDGDDDRSSMLYRTTHRGTVALRLLSNSNSIIFGDSQQEGDELSIIA